MAPLSLRRLAGLALLLGLLATPAAQAQLRVGAHIMPQLTGLYNSSDADFDTTYVRQGVSFTFAGGLYLGYRISDKWEVSLDLNFSNSRQEYLYINDDRTFIGLDREITYLKFPLLVTYTIKSSEEGRLWVQAGPQINILADATDLIGGEDFNIFSRNIGSPLNNIDKYRSLTYSGILGVGYDYKLSDNLSLTTGIRFDATITDVENKFLNWEVTLQNNTGQRTTAAANYHDLIYGRDRGITHHFSVGFLIGVRYQLGRKNDTDNFRW